MGKKSCSKAHPDLANGLEREAHGVICRAPLLKTARAIRNTNLIRSLEATCYEKGRRKGNIGRNVWAVH